MGGAWPQRASGSARRQTLRGVLSTIRSRAPMTRRQSACLTVGTKSISQGEVPACAARFNCCEGPGTQGVPLAQAGRPQAKREGGPSAQPVGHGPQRELPERAQQRDQQQGLVAVATRGTPRPGGQGRGQRRSACWTATRHSASRCRRITSVSASMCRAGPRVVRARWYAGGGTGPVSGHGAGTMG